MSIQRPNLTPEADATLNRYGRVMNAIYDRLAAANRSLHLGQIAMAKAFFIEKKKVIASQWGRSGAKTETDLFIAHVFALLNSNVEVYIICPQVKQAKKIYWSSRRLQTYAPPEFIVDERDSELRMVFDNGSSIVLDGAENVEGLRGIKPHLVIYDEFQDHSKVFDEEVMQPTLMGRNVQLVVTYTPPKKRSAYCVEFRQKIIDEIATGDDTRAYFEFPSWLNPSLDKAELDRKKAALFKAGDETIWYREYEGRLAFGGEGTVFPHYSQKRHVFPHAVLMGALARDKNKLRWFTACDPGSTSCFAVLFGCYNPYTSQIFLLDEIYERDRKLTNSISIWARIKAKEQALYPGHTKGTFRRVYDEAAAWFANEISANFHEAMSPTLKAQSSIDQDISLIKSCMCTDGCFHVSDKLQWLPWEIESFVTDEKGEFPKDNDHLLDTLRYGMKLVNVKFVEKIENANMIINREGGVYSQSNRIQAVVGRQNEDWTEDVVNSSLEVDFNEWN